MNNNYFKKIESNNRAHWVDMAKLLAIVGVMIDHTNGVLYTNQSIAFSSYYSVSLFILVMGVTNYWSYNNYSGSVITKVYKGCWKIFRPYILATFIYCVAFEREFVFSVFLDKLIHFNASLPFYYVLLYIQLLIVSPILYKWLWIMDLKGGRGILGEILIIVPLLFISYLTTNYTNILDVYGGGGKLLGGTYLILLYIGMLFGKITKKVNIKRGKSQILCLIFTIVTLLWWKFLTGNQLSIDSGLPFGSGYNPPSISFGVYGILMMVLIYLLELSVKGSSIISLCYIVVSVLGRHTLYIFLYHRLFLDVVFPYFSIKGIVVTNIEIKRILYFGVMIIGSMIIEYILGKINKSVAKSYNVE